MNNELFGKDYDVEIKEGLIKLKEQKECGLENLINKITSERKMIGLLMAEAKFWEQLHNNNPKECYFRKFKEKTDLYEQSVKDIKTLESNRMDEKAKLEYEIAVLKDLILKCN